ncbi:MAG: hypothetical protein AAGA58_15115 [Verrucomicrobiota bacterium]
MKTELHHEAAKSTALSMSIPPEDLGYLRLYFAIFGIELSEVLDIPGAPAMAD